MVEIDIDAGCAETDLCAKFDVRCGFVSEVNPTVTDVVLVLHRADHSASAFVFIPLVNDRSVLDEVEVLRLVLGIGIMIDDGSQMAVECGRDAGHIAFVAEVLQFASFLMLEVLLGFCEPGGRGYAGRVAVVPRVIRILLYPSVVRGCVEAFGIHSQISQHDALEAAQVAAHRLADVNEALRVRHMRFRPFDDGVGIVLEHLLSVVIVEHDGCAEICALIVG